MSTSIVILAAGKGTRLGMPFPKPLTPIDDGRTILGRSLDLIHSEFGPRAVNIVVGFQSERIVEAFPTERYIYNEQYDQTNTSKSLLRALRAVPSKDGVIWFNGDVVFDETLLARVSHFLMEEQSFVAVNTSSVADEEVKYTVDEYGFIDKLSKTVPVKDALGEAVGINYVSPRNKLALMHNLNKVGNQDYFERGIELAITTGDSNYLPVDISGFGMGAMEVDFQEDLERTNIALRGVTG
jgi:choline kinase